MFVVFDILITFSSLYLIFLNLNYVGLSVYFSKLSEIWHIFEEYCIQIEVKRNKAMESNNLCYIVLLVLVLYYFGLFHPALSELTMVDHHW